MENGCDYVAFSLQETVSDHVLETDYACKVCTYPMGVEKLKAGLQHTLLVFKLTISITISRARSRPCLLQPKIRSLSVSLLFLTLPPSIKQKASVRCSIERRERPYVHSVNGKSKNDTLYPVTYPTHSTGTSTTVQSVRLLA